MSELPPAISIGVCLLSRHGPREPVEATADQLLRYFVAIGQMHMARLDHAGPVTHPRQQIYHLHATAEATIGFLTAHLLWALLAADPAKADVAATGMWWALETTSKPRELLDNWAEQLKLSPTREAGS